MIWVLLVANIGACAILSVVGGRLGRTGLLAAAVPQGATAVWAMTQIGTETPAMASLTWVGGLDLSLTFRVDGFAVLMTLLVAGIGTLVFVYAYGYFSPGAARMGRFTTTLLAFATSMLGLVWADSVWTLFIFWELTTVTSFLLVGHATTEPTVLAAARRALMITGGGGLVLLAGLLVLADASGTTLISELVPVGSAAGTLAAILVMVGAATKSAQVPFHVWLPGAMAAPTPVSAYLHSATMVKAGVVLVAITGPAFATVGAWKVAGLAFGVTSILWGAIGALRHTDAKLILAWGTVSQLGLFITLLSTGAPKAIFAAVALVLAHGLFKAALFLVVGEIDVRTGTREVDELGGLARSMPVSFAVALAAGLSMAGVPPLLGFAAKEAAVEATLGLSGLEAVVVWVGVLGGSVLTVAYTTRFLLLTFGPGPDTEVAPPRPALTVPAVVLGALSLLGFVVISPFDEIVSAAATSLNPEAGAFALLRWPGFTTALAVSAAIVASGWLLGSVVAGRAAVVPAPTGARMTDTTIDGLVAFGRVLCSWIQHGSLPVYVATMGVTAAAAATPFLAAVGTDRLVVWDTALQGVLAVTVVAAAVAVATVTTRIGAGLALGAVGIGVAALFVMHGAPDLVLTQLLVETVIVVGFVIGFGQLSRDFPEIGSAWRTVRLAVAALGGTAVTIALAAASTEPAGEPRVATLADGAVEVGGGNNIVNVILTDVRALDTVGEVVVLAAVAVGILALSSASSSDVRSSTISSSSASSATADPTPDAAVGPPADRQLESAS